MSKPMLKLFGRKLCSKKNDEMVEYPTSQALTSKFVGLYFICPSSSKSKEFTERLIQFHEKMQLKEISSPDSDTDSDFSFKVIMISFDEVDKTVYIPEIMTPFLLLTGEGARDRQEHLIRKYSIQDSPTLILMDGVSGHVINFSPREKILEDPEGLNFPWRHSTLTEIITAGQLLTSGQKEDDVFTGFGNVTQGGTIRGFLFSAYWCPPCRTFLTSLTDAYHRLREQGKKFEIVFVSSDRSKESFDKFFSLMPWLAVPYEDEERRKSLTAALNIKSIPTLVLADSQDNVITADGRTELNNDLEALDFPWHKKLVAELHDKNSSALNHSVCLIYFIQGNDDSEYDNAEAILLPIATQIFESDTEEAFQPKFFIATDSELSESLRLFMDLEESKEYLVILDIPNFRYAVAPNIQNQDDVSAQDFLHKFQTSQLKYRYIQSRFI